MTAPARCISTTVPQSRTGRCGVSGIARPPKKSSKKSCSPPGESTHSSIRVEDPSGPGCSGSHATSQPPGIGATVDTSHLSQLEKLPTAGRDDVELERLVDRSLIADSVRSLSSEHRGVLIAAYWDRLSTREISERLHIPEGTVKSRLFYALRILRSSLDERQVL